jgi:hypothetical protein
MMPEKLILSPTLYYKVFATRTTITGLQQYRQDWKVRLHMSSPGNGFGDVYASSDIISVFSSSAGGFPRLTLRVNSLCSAEIVGECPAQFRQIIVGSFRVLPLEVHKPTECYLPFQFGCVTYAGGVWTGIHSDIPLVDWVKQRHMWARPALVAGWEPCGGGVLLY